MRIINFDKAALRATIEAFGETRVVPVTNEGASPATGMEIFTCKVFGARRDKNKVKTLIFPCRSTIEERVKYGGTYFKFSHHVTFNYIGETSFMATPVAWWNKVPKEARLKIGPFRVMAIDTTKMLATIEAFEDTRKVRMEFAHTRADEERIYIVKCFADDWKKSGPLKTEIKVSDTGELSVGNHKPGIGFNAVPVDWFYTEKQHKKFKNE